MAYTSEEAALLSSGKTADARLINGELRYVMQTIVVPAGGIPASGDIQLVDLPEGCHVVPQACFLTHDGVGVSNLTLFSAAADDGAYGGVSSEYSVVFVTAATAGKVSASVNTVAAQFPRVRPADATSDRCLKVGLRTSGALTAGKKIVLFLAVTK